MPQFSNKCCWWLRKEDRTNNARTNYSKEDTKTGKEKKKLKNWNVGEGYIHRMIWAYIFMKKYKSESLEDKI